jgi:hypothetical protein
MTREHFPGAEKPPEASVAQEESSSVDPRLRVAMQRRIVRRKAARDAAAGPRAEIPDGGGTRLDKKVQKQVAPHVDADLSKVRVHTGAESDRAAKQLGARAFTDGDNIHFAGGEFAPGTREGDRLLLHELAHVAQGPAPQIQRKEDPKAGGGEPAGVSQPEDTDEKKADAVADKGTADIHDKKEADKEGGADPDKAKDEVKLGAAGMPDKPEMYQDMMQVAAEFAPKFEPLGLTLGPEILLAIARQESGKGLNPNQVSFDHGMGLMQITPSKDGKLDPSVAECLGWDNTKSFEENNKAGAWKNVLGNLRAGATVMLGKVQYLAKSKKTAPIWATMSEQQRWRAVMFAYNAGEGTASKALEAGGADAKMISRYTDAKGNKVEHDYTAEAQGNLDYVNAHNPFAAAEKQKAGGGQAAPAQGPPAQQPAAPAQAGPAQPGPAQAGPAQPAQQQAPPQADPAQQPQGGAPAPADPAQQGGQCEEEKPIPADGNVCEEPGQDPAANQSQEPNQSLAPNQSQAPAPEPAAPTAEAPVPEPPKPDKPKKHPELDEIRAGALILELAAVGEAVLLIQQLLGVPADGKFGPHTHKAVCKLQEKKGLSVDGKVGKHTLKALEQRDDD